VKTWGEIGMGRGKVGMPMHILYKKAAFMGVSWNASGKEDNSDTRFSEKYK
jgi:hypothetical protein